jgi:hypothetical protein
VLRAGHALRAAEVGTYAELQQEVDKEREEGEVPAKKRRADLETAEALKGAADRLFFTFSSRNAHAVFSALPSSTEDVIVADGKDRAVLRGMVNDLAGAIMNKFNIGFYNSIMGRSLIYNYEDVLGKVMLARTDDLLQFEKRLALENNRVDVWSAARLLLRNLELGRDLVEDEIAILASRVRNKMDDAAAVAGFVVADEVYKYTGRCAERQRYAEWDEDASSYPGCEDGHLYRALSGTDPSYRV